MSFRLKSIYKKCDIIFSYTLLFFVIFLILFIIGNYQITNNDQNSGSMVLGLGYVFLILSIIYGCCYIANITRRRSPILPMNANKVDIKFSQVLQKKIKYTIEPLSINSTLNYIHNAKIHTKDLEFDQVICINER